MDKNIEQPRPTRRQFMGMVAATLASPALPYASSPALASSTLPMVSADVSSTLALEKFIHGLFRKQTFKMQSARFNVVALLRKEGRIPALDEVMANMQHTSYGSPLSPIEDTWLFEDAHELLDQKPSHARILKALEDIYEDHYFINTGAFRGKQLDEIASELINALDHGPQGIEAFLNRFDAYVNHQVRHYVSETINTLEEETKKPNFTDMAAARKSGGYPIPAHYTPAERHRVAVGKHATSGEWSTRISTLSADDNGVCR